MEHFKNKRRLIKELPFAKVGDILEKMNGGIWIKGGRTYYSSHSTSDNATNILEKNEEELVNTLWDNDNWFQPLEKYTFYIGSDNKNQVVLKSKETVDTDTLDTIVKFTQQLLDKELEKYWHSKGHREYPIEEIL